MSIKAVQALCVTVVNIGLVSCASLPAREASAFRDIGKVDSSAFGNTAQSEVGGATEAAIIQAGQNGLSLTAVNCGVGEPDKTKCTLTLAGQGTPPLALTERAPKTRELIASIASYGNAMADLAEAKDVASAQANVDAAATAVGSLATLTGVAAPAAAVAKGMGVIAKYELTETRRHALLVAAQQADPAIKVAAKNLSEITAQLKQNLLDSGMVRINTYKLALDRSNATLAALDKQMRALPQGASGDAQRMQLQQTMEFEQGQRVYAADGLVKVAADINTARAIRTDFSSLTTAHTALIAALSDPKVGMADAFAGINGFLSAAASAKGK